jgi:hypothetical protein
MKALTVCQPYASAIMAGLKGVENRSWPTNYRGHLAIHAGKSKGWLEEAATWYGEELLPLGMKAWEWERKLPFGALLGFVDLVECLPVEKYRAVYPDDGFACGPWCWVVRRPVKLEKPFECAGAQGLWETTGLMDEMILQACRKE